MSTEERTDVLSGGVTDIHPSPRAAINQDDLQARMSNQHAEVTALEQARKNDLTPDKPVTYPEPFRLVCQQYLDESGLRLVDDFHGFYRFGGRAL